MKEGRLANTMLFFVKHSSTANGDDKMTIGCLPNWSENMFPYFCERACKVRWSGFLMR